jgi:NAD(P)-dependent dehydrogenase (short-subunit alcohol dehydrogenase family)
VTVAHGIRVNSISPGLIESGATRAQLDETDGWARAAGVLAGQGSATS